MACDKNIGNTPVNTSIPPAEHRNMKTSDQNGIVYNSFEQDKKTGFCIVQNTMTNPPFNMNCNVC